MGKNNYDEVAEDVNSERAEIQHYERLADEAHDKMMKEEFNLSDCMRKDCSEDFEEDVIAMLDVKEFIKRLKTFIIFRYGTYADSKDTVCIINAINKLAGDKLV